MVGRDGDGTDTGGELGAREGENEGADAAGEEGRVGNDGATEGAEGV